MEALYSGHLTSTLCGWDRSSVWMGASPFKVLVQRTVLARDCEV